jgi:hypothetical protein
MRPPGPVQRHNAGGLSDIKTFAAEQGVSWIDSAGRLVAQRIDRLAPKGFPKNNRFDNTAARQANGKGPVES